MADVNLTQQDIDYIARVVDTEVPAHLARTHPAEYERMVQGVVDTVTNRIESGRFPNTVTGVANQKGQFSKISGPSRLSPYGSVQNAPKASPRTQNAVYDYVAARAQGAPPTVGGALNYANPNFSDKRNLTGWINPMIEAGAKALGIGKNTHYHGNAPGVQPVGYYTLAAQGMPSGPVPTPTPRGTLPSQYGIMAAIDPFAPMPVERGLLGPASIPASITPGPVTYGGLMGPPSMPGQAGKTGRVSGPPQSAVKETPVAAFAPNEAPPAFDPGRFGPQIQTPTAPSAVIDRFATTQPVAQGRDGLRSAMNTTFDAARFGAPVTGPTPIDATVAGLQKGLLGQVRDVYGALPDIPPAPAPGALLGAPPVDPVTTATPATPAPTYTPTPTYAAQPAQPAMSAAQRTYNERMALGAPAPSALGPQMARDAQRGLGQRSMIGGIGGALLGGALLGPVGGLLGGLMGRSYAQRTYSPPAPERIPGQPMGTAAGGGVSYGDLNDYGREAYSSSGDFRDAIDSGGVGLY